jgi:tryptophan halogenase
VDCDGTLRPSLIKQYNKRWRCLVENEREFLGLFYRFNTRLDSPFWQEARQNSHVGELDPILRCYQDIGPDSLHRSLLLYENDPIGLEGYFSVLVGQRVPWSNPWKPSAEELAQMSVISETWRRLAGSAFSVSQANDSLLGRTPTQRVQTKRVQTQRGQTKRVQTKRVETQNPKSNSGTWRIVA